MINDLYIVGSGGLAKEVFLLTNNFNFKYFIGNEKEKIKINKKEFKVISDIDFFEKIKNEDIVNVIIAVGNINLRKKLSVTYSKIKNILFPNIIDSSCSINLEYNNIGIGNIFTQHSIFTSNINIGNFNYFNIGCTIGHDVEIGNCNVFNPTCNISGKVEIGNNNLFGVNSTVLENLKIGSNNIIGASSLITKNVGDNSLMVGIPAKNKNEKNG